MMRSTWRVFRNEAAKMARLKMIYLGPVCIVLVSLVFTLNLMRLTQEKSANGWSLLTQASQLNVTGVLPLFVLIYAASLVAGEAERGTIRFTLSRPVGRVSFLLGKTLAAGLYLSILLAVTAAAGLLAGGSFGSLKAPGGFGDSTWTASRAAWQIAACFALTLLPLGSVAMFALTVSVYARSLLGAICFAIGAWITLTLTQAYFSGQFYLGSYDASDLVFASGLDLPLRVAQSIASDSASPWDEPRLIVSLAVSAGWAAAFFAISAIGFCRQDLNRAS